MSNNLKQQLDDLRADCYKVGARKSCPPEESKVYRQLLKDGQPLPEGVFQMFPGQNPEGAVFYKCNPKFDELSPQEHSEFLTLKKLKLLKTIKNCVVFFTILAILDLIIGIF